MDTLWACEPTYLQNYLERLISFGDMEHRPDLDALIFGEPIVGAQKIWETDGDTMTINIDGVLSPKGPPPIAAFFGFAGTAYRDINDALKEAAANDSIKIVRLLMDTPGGLVSGVDEVWQNARSLAATKKVVAQSKGMIASAGYWIASAANRIEASSPVDIIGSIGIIVSTIDVSRRMDSAGVRRIVLTSSNAPNKNADLSTERGQGIMQAEIDAVERNFIDRVATGRGVTAEKVISDFGKGGVLVARDPDDKKPDALTAGMIDGITFMEKETAMDRRLAEAGNAAKQAMEIIANDDIVATDKEEQAQSQTIYPASGYANTKEDEGMSILAKLMQEHPELQAEIDKIESEAFARGKQADHEKFAAIATYLSSDAYPNSIKNMAQRVVAGEMTLGELNAAVGAYDAIKEEQKQSAAVEDTNDVQTPPTQAINGIPEDGEINSLDSFEAEVTAAKAARGY